MSTLADEMAANALEAQRFSRKHLVLELDFSAFSIHEIEANADTVEYAIKGGKSDENVAMLVRVWGAYLGEALRKQAGGEWAREEDGRLSLRGPNTTTHPQEQVRRRLLEGKAFDLSEYFARTVAEL